MVAKQFKVFPERQTGKPGNKGNKLFGRLRSLFEKTAYVFDQGSLIALPPLFALLLKFVESLWFTQQVFDQTACIGP